MPLPPLPANNTPRGLIQYTSGGLPHVAQCRFAIAETPSGALGLIEGLIDAMLGLMQSSDSITGGLWYAAGSDISIPWDVPPASGSHSPFLDDDAHRAAVVGFAGRSSGGRRVTWHMFTGAFANDTDFRHSRADVSPAAQALYDAVRDPATGLRAKDGIPPNWKAYLNVGVNAYYQRALR